MKKTTVYDLPTRLFHWTFSGLFIGAFLIANVIDDDSPLFSIHMLMGLTMMFLVLLRLIWGVIGSKWARMSSFSLHPRLLISYFKDVLTSKTQLYPGHNPASSWAAILMFSLTLGLSLTGYFITTGVHSDTLEELHEFFALGFVVTVVVHVAGVLIHSLQHRDAIGMSMIHGKKVGISNTHKIKTQHTAPALLAIILFGFFSYYLYTHYHHQTQTLTVFNRPLLLGEPSETEDNTHHLHHTNHDGEIDDD